MAQKFRRIGVLTSGGDAPGMNAAVRSVVRSAIGRGVEVMAIYGGYRGLIEDDVKMFTERDVSNIIGTGGTAIYSDRCLEFKEEPGMQKAIATCKKYDIDGIVTIGGDGTFRGAMDLTKRGVACIGIPGTIDNDITSTDHSIGFDTAMNIAMDCVDKLRDTCTSHERCAIVEVMGRGAGYIALNTGIATGAEMVILPDKDVLLGIARVPEISSENNDYNYVVDYHKLSEIRMSYHLTLEEGDYDVTLE